MRCSRLLPGCICVSVFPGAGADHVSAERRERAADDVREAGALGLHLPDVRVPQQDPGAAQRPGGQTPGRAGSRALLRALRLQRQVRGAAGENPPWQITGCVGLEGRSADRPVQAPSQGRVTGTHPGG